MMRKPPGKKRRLTDQQARFVQFYLVSLNATRAAIEAGYSQKSAHVQAVALMKNLYVRAAISKLKAKQLQKADLSAARTLEEGRRLSFSNIGRYYDRQGRLLPLHEMSEEDRACIASVKTTMWNEDGRDGKQLRVVELKLWDKNKALDNLMKHFNLVQQQDVDADLGALIMARLRGAYARTSPAPSSPVLPEPQGR
jgi:phage terminase small subunit